MSLLMDALRRAESAGREASTDTGSKTLSEALERPASNSPLQLEPVEAPTPPADAAAPAGAVPEIHPEALSEEANDAAQTTPQQAQSALDALMVRRRSAARRHLVFAVAGSLSAAAILAGYYFWQVDTEVHYGVAPAAVLIDNTESAAPSVPAATQVTGSETDPDTPVAATLPTPAPATEAPVSTAVEQPSDEPTASSEPASPAADYRIEIQRARRTPRVPDDLQQAYRTYSRGDYPEAEALYRQVLKRWPDNRDAMLGLGAIALHQGNRQLARYYYERILKSDPADKAAMLALQGLGGGNYSLESGSRLKYWLQTDADNPQLHFALGNQYAAAGQWKEAQASYFEAHRLAPASADYAFNLAVSLDQLGLPGQALQYYLQARTLSGGGALFSRAQLDDRIRQLQAAGDAP